MREVYLEGRLMTDRAAAHAEIKDKLSLPEYYGANLDALWDCLIEIGEETGYYSPSSRRYVFCPAGIWLPFADDIF